MHKPTNKKPTFSRKELPESKKGPFPARRTYANRPAPNRKSETSSPDTSWQKVGKWYNEAVGEEGLYYHQSIILPSVTGLMELPENGHADILDLACGQGVLARHLPKTIGYVGIDLASSLISAARKQDPNQSHQYLVGDITKTLQTKKKDFSIATLILALQNIEHPLNVFQNAFKHLVPGGKFIIVMNHPCFRIPRQSSWKIDEANKTQYRRLDRYFSALKIPIQAHPSKGEKSPETWSFHYPLSSYTKWLRQAGFSILQIDEWCSDKVSTGGAAKMENRAREEFPLFLAIVAQKNVE